MLIMFKLLFQTVEIYRETHISRKHSSMRHIMQNESINHAKHNFHCTHFELLRRYHFQSINMIS